MDVLRRIGTVPAVGARGVRLSPDGLGLLTMGSDRVLLWDVATARLAWSHERATPPEFPVDAAWGADGMVVAVLAGAWLGLLDASTGGELPLPEVIAGRDDVTALAMSADGRTLAVGTHEGLVVLWSSDTGVTSSLHGGGESVTALAWHPRADELCVARPRSLQLWRPSARVMTSSTPMGDFDPSRVAWTPDGARIAATGGRGVRVLSAASRRDATTPLRTGGSPHGVAVGRTGTVVLVGLPDGSLDVFDGQLRRPAVTPAAVGARIGEAAGLHVNETGLLALPTGEREVGLFALPDTVVAPPEQHRRVALTRWAARLVAGDPALAGDQSDPPAPPVPTPLATRSRFAWAPDGWYLQDRSTGTVARIDADGRQRWSAAAGSGELAVGGGVVAVDAPRGGVVLLDAESGARLGEVEGGGRAACATGAVVVAAPDRRDLLVHDPHGAGPTRIVPVSEELGTPCWSPDERTLVVPTGEGVLVWDGSSWLRQRRLEADVRPRHAVVAWSPDGDRLALAQSGRPTAVWSTANWSVRGSLAPAPAGGVLAWSPDSRLLATPAARPAGAVDVWDVRAGRIVLTLPPPPSGRRPVAGLAWAADGRFAVVHDDGTVVRWALTLPGADEDQVPPARMAALVVGTAATGTMVPLGLLSDLMSLLTGADAGALEEFGHHPGVTLLRSLRWPPDAVVGLAVLVAAGLPAEEELLPPDDVSSDEVRGAVLSALGESGSGARPYEPPTAALLGELDRIDDSVIVLATLLGPDAVAAAPELLARVRGESFGGWSFAPRQRRLLGLRAALRGEGSSQGHGVGDARAGIARHGELPSLLPSQLALPRLLLGYKISRDELLFRTREGDVTVEAQPLVLVLDDTPAAFGAVGVTLRIVANLLAAVALRGRRRCALVGLGKGEVAFLDEMADLVRLWGAGGLERPDLPVALNAASGAAAQLGDTVAGSPRLVVLTHPHLACPSRPGLHVVRVHYPGVPVVDSAPRTHVVPPGAGPEDVHHVIGAIMSDRT